MHSHKTVTMAFEVEEKYVERAKAVMKVEQMRIMEVLKAAFKDQDHGKPPPQSVKADPVAMFGVGKGRG